MYGQRLRQLRLEQGYTMEEVGRKVGIKKSSYASYESKYRQPPLDKLISFSKLYGVSVDYILGLTERKGRVETQHCIVKEKFEKNGFHWDGLNVPEDVLHIIENILVEADQQINTDIKEG